MNTDRFLSAPAARRDTLYLCSSADICVHLWSPFDPCDAVMSDWIPQRPMLGYKNSASTPVYP